MIRLANQEDWPLIVAWRDAHFAEMATRMNVSREIIGQKEFDEAVWIVYERGGVPVAALSFTQDDEQRIRWAHDLYAAQVHAIAGLLLVKHFEQYCDETGYEIRGQTDPENTEYLKLVDKRGYERTAIAFRRRPRMAKSEHFSREEQVNAV